MRSSRIHCVMLIFYLTENMFIMISNVKTSVNTICWDFPPITGKLKNILMKITNIIRICLINLSYAFGFNSFFVGFIINLWIKCQFDRIYKIFIKRLQVNIITIFRYSFLSMIALNYNFNCNIFEVAVFILVSTTYYIYHKTGS